MNGHFIHFYWKTPATLLALLARVGGRGSTAESTVDPLGSNSSTLLGIHSMIKPVDHPTRESATLIMARILKSSSIDVLKTNRSVSGLAPKSLIVVTGRTIGNWMGVIYPKFKSPLTILTTLRFEATWQITPSKSNGTTGISD